MSDNEEEEKIEIQLSDVDDELEKINNDIYDVDKSESKIMERLKGQLEISNKLLEGPNQYPNIRRYTNGIALILFIVSIFIFLNLTQNRDRDLY